MNLKENNISAMRTYEREDGAKLHVSFSSLGAHVCLVTKEAGSGGALSLTADEALQLANALVMMSIDVGHVQD